MAVRAFAVVFVALAVCAYVSARVVSELSQALEGMYP